MAPSSGQSGIWVSRPSSSPYGGMRAPGSKIRLLVADDHAAYRKGLRTMFALEPDMQAVGEAGDGQEAIEQVAALKPDVVLMDVNMPGVDGMEATRKLTDTYPGILIIILTMFKGEEHLREARRAGASAYVLKDAGSEVLLQAIRDVMSGETPILTREDQTTASQPPAEPPPVQSIRRGGNNTDILVTANERQILRLLAAGMTNDQIGRETGMPESMVRTYLAEIYRKLGLPGREAAAQFAREHHLDQ